MKILRHTLWTAVGLFALAALAAMPAAADFVINDDLIVDGSACIGFDCVNGENFGFDTLRLKENNLRVHFDDTSSTASFPRNDWRIVINATTNGGDEYFAIEDSTAGRLPFRVAAGAPANSLTVDAQGDIGINRLNAVVELHIVDGDTPTVRLEQDGSSGFTAQTWDLAGNEANFFIRDVTNGSQLPFRIVPGADTNSLAVADDNDIGMGTNTPKAQLHVIQGGSAITPGVEPVLLMQNSAAAGDAAFFVLVAGNNSNAQVAFGDTDEEFAGQLLYQHNGDFFEFYTQATPTVRIDDNTTAGQAGLLLRVDDTFERVSVEGADSCGTGFRCLRVPN